MFERSMSNSCTFRSSGQCKCAKGIQNILNFQFSPAKCFDFRFAGCSSAQARQRVFRSSSKNPGVPAPVWRVTSHNEKLRANVFVSLVLLRDAIEFY